MTEGTRTIRYCEKCRAALAPDAPQGLCPACLLRLAITQIADSRSVSDRGGEMPGTAADENDSAPALDPPGSMIGHYRLLDVIGEGGFGVVYRAEQIEPVQREVALKVIKAGMDTREVIARFEIERQALAVMDHPGIARVYDGGVTPTRRPYIAMELVRGVPITGFCDDKKLPTTGRLRLFIQVCKAIQHAHQKGIIHRDLKPSNILVTMHDGEPVPKVIDFGVAKALEHKLTESSMVTGFLRMVGTPAYMSPEQAELGVFDVDTRSDIYALGVLLYELLTGVTPFETERFRKAALDEVRRTIRETDPPKPSTRLEMLGGKLDKVADLRRTDPPKLMHRVRGDLDWIVMKCLEKDRRRRYETVNGLAMDVQRHLENEPVAARPPTAGYRFYKLVRRNKLAFAAGGAIALSVLAGLTVSTVSLLREKAARSRAESAEKTAEAATLEKQEQLWRSQLIEARHYRTSGQPGQRTRTLNVVDEAAKWRPSIDLRNEAIASLVLPDLGTDVWFREQRSAGFDFACDADLEHYTPYSPQGQIEVRRTKDHAVVASFDGLSGDITWSQFSPDGKRLAVYFGRAAVNSRVGLWDWREGRRLLDAVSGLDTHSRPVFDFTPDGREFLMAAGSGPVRRFSAEDGRELEPPLPATDAVCLRVSPSGQAVAIGTRSGLRLWSLAGNRQLAQCALPGNLQDIAWHPHEELVAIGTGSGLFLWKVGAKDATLISRPAPTEYITHVFFDPDGALVVAGGHGNFCGIWDAESGRLLLSCKDGAPVRLSRDGATMAYARERIGIGARRFLRPIALRRNLVPVSLSGEYGTLDTDFHPNGHWLLSAHLNGWLIWDSVRARIVARHRGARINTARFLPGGTSFMTCGYAGVQRWNVPTFDASLQPHSALDAPISLPPPVPESETVLAGKPYEFERLALSPEGNRFAVVGTVGASLVSTLDGSKAVQLAGSETRPGTYISFSPDGKWILTGAQHGTQLNVYDALSGRHARDLPTGGAIGVFHPNGQFVMASGPLDYTFWHAGTWEIAGRFPWGTAGLNANSTGFSRDGRYFFVNDIETHLRLRDIATHQDVATFMLPGISAWETCFDPGGQRLVVSNSTAQLFLWDLAELRQELARFGLDWPNEHPGEGFVGRLTGN